MLKKLTGRPARLMAALTAAAALALPVPAYAASCFISPESVNFGFYDPFSPAAQDGVGNIAVSCDAPTSFTLSLGPGHGTYDARRMQGATDAMAYNLYTDASRLFVWGDGTGSSSTVSDMATSANYPVYGRIPPGQNVPADIYSDTIVVTVTY